MLEKMCNIYYYIYAPRYVPTSAGIRGLYVLAQALRSAGENAWVVTYKGHVQDELPQDMQSLILDYDLALDHERAGFDPIVIYSETVSGNPLGAAAVVRYVMNVPGLLGGEDAYAESECVYAFSEALAQQMGRPDWSLFIPLVDDERFVPPAKGTRRKFICFYAAKFRNVHNGVPSGVPDGAYEITRDLTHSPEPEAIVELLQRTKTLYLFENTALAIEAVLCGAEVVFMPNPYLTLSIGALDHGTSGMAWGNSDAELARAKRTISKFRSEYSQMKAAFPERLALFIKRTKAYRMQVKGRFVDWPLLKPPGYIERAGDAALRYAKDRGFAFLAVKAIKVLFKHGPSTTVSIIAQIRKSKVSH